MKKKIAAVVAMVAAAVLFASAPADAKPDVSTPNPFDASH